MRPRSESRAVSPDRSQGFGILTHIGRKSGRVYRTPVNLFRAPVCTWGLLEQTRRGSRTSASTIAGNSGRIDVADQLETCEGGKLQQRVDAWRQSAGFV